MTDRKKKIYLAQIFLLVAGLTVLIFTYQKKESLSPDQISIEKSENKPFEESEQMDGVDFFYNIQYSGIDRSGNRYILKAEKAISKKDSEEMIDMISVNAVFYIKDGTELYIKSDNGIYNNKTLDMVFKNNVEAKYEDNKLYSQRAEYSNSNNFFIISKDISVESEKGKLSANELFFDLKEEKLKISSSNEEIVNAVIDVK